MIFVTVGSMLPFDRLIRTVDAWAKLNPDINVVAQIGDGSYLPTHMTWSRMLAPTQFKQYIAECKLIVAHAGMGTVIGAAQAAKPLVLLPRRHALKEHTTNHQQDTAKWLKGRPGIHIAHGEDELPALIELSLNEPVGNLVIGEFAPPQITDALRAYLLNT